MYLWLTSNCIILILKKVDTVLEEAIQEHDSKKEELKRLIQATTKTGKTPSNEEKSKVTAL